MKKSILYLLFFIFMIDSYRAFSDDVPLLLSGKNIVKQTPLEISWEKIKKPSIVIFLSMNCPCSQAHIPYLKKLYADYPQYFFLAVHSNNIGPDSKLQEYFSTLELPFSVIQDTDQQWANVFKAYKTPHAFIVSPNGHILYKGGISNSSSPLQADEFPLQQALEDLKHQREIKVKQSRTIGCMITRRS